MIKNKNFLGFIENTEGRIFIVANSVDYLDCNKLQINKKDALVIFNQPKILNAIENFSRVLWIHRHDEWNNCYFGESLINNFENNNIYHIALTNRLLPKPEWAKECISIDEIPNIKKYPIGKKIFGIKRGKFIRSPSTGYAVLEMINGLRKTKTKELIYAIGFGQFPNGWYEHAWSFERKCISRMGFHLLTKDVKYDRTMYLRGQLPDFLVNLVFDLHLKFKK